MLLRRSLGAAFASIVVVAACPRQPKQPLTDAGTVAVDAAIPGVVGDGGTRGGGGNQVPRDAGGGEVADAGSLAHGHLAFTIEGLVEQCSYIFVATVGGVERDAYFSQGTIGGVDWHVYADVVSFSVERRFFPSQVGDERMRLYPVRCEGFVDGGRVSQRNSICSARTESNSVALGERVVACATGRPTAEVPSYLYLRLLVNANDEVDLTPLSDEAQGSATLEAVRSRIEAAVASRVAAGR